LSWDYFYTDSDFKSHEINVLGIKIITIKEPYYWKEWIYFEKEAMEMFLKDDEPEEVLEQWEELNIGFDLTRNPYQHPNNDLEALLKKRLSNFLSRDYEKIRIQILT